MKNFIFRHSLTLILAALFSILCATSFADTQGVESTSVQEELKALEASSGVRIGIFAINTANNDRIEYRGKERFTLGSTFKVMVAAAILKRSAMDSHLLEQKVNYKKEDIDNTWSPIAKDHIADGMTIADLTAAALMYSDNTASNLLVKKLGGLAAVNTFAHSLGDNTFRLDHWEPDLNTTPGDLHDTTTPEAMAISLQRLVLGDVLASPQRKQLQDWLKGNTTGDLRIRAGVPKSWVVGDKTGSGLHYGVVNDIAVIWPPKCPPIVVALFSTQNKKDAARKEEVITSATRLLLNAFAKTDQCLKL